MTIRQRQTHQNTLVIVIHRSSDGPAKRHIEDVNVLVVSQNKIIHKGHGFDHNTLMSGPGFKYFKPP